MLPLAYYYWTAAASLYAAGDGAGVPDVSAWAEYGPATVSASIFASIAWILFGMQRETLRLERERNTKSEAEVYALNKQLREQIVPVLTQFSSEAARLSQVNAEVARALESWKGRDR